MASTVPYTLYHITREEHVAGILRDGILPGRIDGKWVNARAELDEAADDIEPLVHLTDREHLDVWLREFQANGIEDLVVLEVKTAGMSRILRGPDDAEYVTRRRIPAWRVRRVDIR